MLSRTAAVQRPVPTDRTFPCFGSPDDVLVLVAGGGGLYSAVLPSWCAGPHRNRAVTVEIELDQACEVPGLSP